MRTDSYQDNLNFASLAEDKDHSIDKKMSRNRSRGLSSKKSFASNGKMQKMSSISMPKTASDLGSGHLKIGLSQRQMRKDHGDSAEDVFDDEKNEE